MKNPEQLPSRRNFIRKTLFGLGGIVASTTLGKGLIDSSFKSRFEEQKKWMLEYILSPKYRERIKRSLARGFFEKDKRSLTAEEIRALRTNSLEQLYPTDIDVSNVSNDLVDNIVKKRIDNLDQVKMGVVNNIIAPQYRSIVGGAYIDSEERKRILNETASDEDAVWSNATKRAVAEGRNILFERLAVFFCNTATTPAHELSHATTKGNNDLEQKLQDVTEGRSNLYYYSDASEIKARLDTLRYELEKSGIYDPKKEDFNKSHLERAIKDKTLKDSSALRELLEHVDQHNGEDLIWFMNNVADVGSVGVIDEEETIAFLGRDSLSAERLV